MKKLFTFLLLLGATSLTLLAQTEYTGSVSVMVGGSYGPYTNPSISQLITSEADGSLTLTICEYTLPATVMGDLTLGQYTVSNLVYDAEHGGYYRDYTNDGLTMHFRAESNGVATMDQDYTFEKKGGNVLVTFADDGTATIVNTFQPGVMPFAIVSTFVGQPSTEQLSQVNDTSTADARTYDLAGRPVPITAKGWHIVAGKKCYQK